MTLKAKYSLLVTAAVFALFATPRNLRANHGPGASGGGNATVSGETLNPGHFEFSLREDYSSFEHFSREAAEQRARTGGDFDALNRGFLTTADLAYGVTEDLQIGASIGYFAGKDFVAADAQDADVETGTVDPHGLTDLFLSGKYRVLRGKPGNLAVVGGVIAPTGRTDVTLDNGERLHPTDQPGTGRWGLTAGLGYSRFLTPRITIDASALYTYRFERDSFKVGDRIDTGVALAYRITDSIKHFPQTSVFAEINNVYLMKDREDASSDPNSGSDALYFTPGARLRLSPHAALTIAPSIPIWQHVNGDQGKVEFKFAVMFSISY